MDGILLSECLRKFQLTLINDVDPSHLVDYLFQEKVIDADDMERVLLPGQTRRDKCRQLLTMVHRQVIINPNAWQHFLISLSGIYKPLYDKLSLELETLQMETLQKSSAVDYFYKGNAGLASEKSIKFGYPDVTKCNRFPVQCTGGVDGTNSAEQEQKNVGYFLYDYKSEPANQNLLYRGNTLSHERFELKSPDLEIGKCYKQDTESFSGSPNRTSSMIKEKLSKNDPVLERNNSIPLHDNTRIDTKTQNLPNNGHHQSDEFYQQLVKAFKEALFEPRVLPPSDFGNSTRLSYQKLFNEMSDVINQGNFCQFDQYLCSMESAMRRDAEIACILLYLDACKGVIQSNYRNCKRSINCALQLVSKVRSPGRTTVELLSVRCWMYIKRANKASKLEMTLNEATSIIAQDPVTCTGKSAGWIYVDRAKGLVSLMCSAHGDCARIDKLRHRAILSLKTAMEHFQQDSSRDGPYGFSYAACKLASLNIACDDRLRLMRQLTPSKKELVETDELLRVVDDSTGGMVRILRPLYLIGLSDLKYRSGMTRRAYELAQDALEEATRLNLGEEMELSRLRSEIYGSCSEDGEGKVAGCVAGDKMPLGVLAFARQASSGGDSKYETDAEDDERLEMRRKTKRVKVRNGSHDVRSWGLGIGHDKDSKLFFVFPVVVGVVFVFVCSFWLQWTVFV